MNVRRRDRSTWRPGTSSNVPSGRLFGPVLTPFGHASPWLSGSAHGQVMQALQIERQTDQTPLVGRRGLTPQRKSVEAQHLLDDPDHWLDGAFAGSAAKRSCQLWLCASRPVAMYGSIPRCGSTPVNRGHAATAVRGRLLAFGGRPRRLGATHGERGTWSGKSSDSVQQ